MHVQLFGRNFLQLACAEVDAADMLHAFTIANDDCHLLVT